jgi:hypothetical protein
MEQGSKWYTEIGDPHFKPTTCEICGESPISQDTAGINKTLALVKQEDWRRRVNRIGWHQVEVRVNTLTAWVFRQMILSRRFKIREIKMATTQVSETDGSDGQDRDGIEEKRFSPEWNAIKANQLSVRRNNFLSDDMSALSLPKLLIAGVVRTEITSFAACTNERHKGYSPDQRWFEDTVRDMGTKYDRVLGTNQWTQVERAVPLTKNQLTIRVEMAERHSLDAIYRSDDWPKILDHDAHDPYSGRRIKPAKGSEPELSRFQQDLLKIRRVSEELPDYLEDAGSLRIKVKCHNGCDDLMEPRPAWVHTWVALSRIPVWVFEPIKEIWNIVHNPTGGHAELTNGVRTSISGLLDWTQQNLDEWSDSIDEKEYACPICGQGILEDETGISKLFSEARPLTGLPRVYFFHATLHFDLRFLTALERVTSNAQPCFTSYEHVATASDSAANSRPLTGIEQHRGPHHRCQIAGDGQAQRWIPLDLESEQIRLVKSEILAGSVTIQFTTQPSDPQEIFIVPATAPFIVVIDGSPLVALGRRCSHHRGEFALVQVRGPGLSCLRPRFKLPPAPV